MAETLNMAQELKRKFRSGEKTLGLWISLESPTITEIATHLGLDWICIDTEHGQLDFKEVTEHLRAANRAHTTVLVRISEIEQGQIKRVLDLGADGILLPQVCSATEVETAVRFAKYPPDGIRGIGAERATLWGRAILRARTYNDNTLVIPLIETKQASENIEAISAVPGVDAFFFGPADLSASMGYPGMWEGSGVAETILALRQRLSAKGFPCGILATDAENGRLRSEQGFQMIGLGTDVGLFIRSLTGMLEGLGRTTNPGTWK